MPSTNERASRIGHSFVPKWWIVAFTVLLLVLAAALLYSLWAFWPSELETVNAKPNEHRVTYFGAGFDVSTDTLFFAVVALAGALGGLVHTLRSFSMYVGTRYLRWSWIPFNLLLPMVGALGGTVFYLVFRGGLFSTSTSPPMRTRTDSQRSRRRRSLLGAGDREAAPCGKGDVRRGAEVRTRQFLGGDGGRLVLRRRLPGRIARHARLSHPGTSQTAASSSRRVRLSGRLGW